MIQPFFVRKTAYVGRHINILLYLQIIVVIARRMWYNAIRNIIARVRVSYTRVEAKGKIQERKLGDHI